MSDILAPGAQVTVSLAASDKIALYSAGSYQLLQTVGYPNYPSTNGVIAAVTSGAYTSSAFTNAQDVIILNDGIFPVYYEHGTAPVVQAIRGQVYQGDPNALNATGSVTAAMILGGIVTSTTAAAVAGTVPTGPVLDAASTFAIGDAIDWSVITTGANAFTVTAASGHTLVGNMVVAAGKAGLFRTRKTAANTFVTYSLANT